MYKRKKVPRSSFFQPNNLLTCMDGDTNDLFMNFCQKKIVTEEKERAPEQKSCSNDTDTKLSSRCQSTPLTIKRKAVNCFHFPTLPIFIPFAK